MDKAKFKQSSSELKEMTDALKPYVDNIVEKHSKSLDAIINKMKKNMATMTVKELNDTSLELAIETFYFAESRDISLLQQECATALYNMHYADVYTGTDGTQNTKSNMAFLETQENLAVKILFNAVSTRLKTKLDEAHRVWNALNSVIISRNAENKQLRERSEPDDDLRINDL